MDVFSVLSAMPFFKPVTTKYNYFYYGFWNIGVKTVRKLAGDG